MQKLALAVVMACVIAAVACNGSPSQQATPGATGSPAAVTPDPTASSSPAAAQTPGQRSSPAPAGTSTPRAVTGGPPVLTRGPYLQNCSEQSVTLIWHTRDDAESFVEYGLDGFAQRAGGGARARQHQATLSGLVSGETYSYRVVADGAPVFTGSFATNEPEGGDPFTFVAFGDSGSGDREQLEVAAEMTAARPALAVHAGDVVYPSGAAERYDAALFRPYGELMSRACLFPITGDHDLITEEGQPYFDAFVLPANNPAASERYYSFDYGDAHFVAIDTNIVPEGKPFDTPEAVAMTDWLKADLAASTREWTVAYLHHPPYSSGAKHGSYPEVRDTFGPIFESYGVDLVFSGDDHDFERFRPVRESATEGPGVTYVVTGGGGSTIRGVGWSPETGFAASKHHFVKVAVSADRLELEAVDRLGRVFDRYSILRDQREAPVTGRERPGGPLKLLVCAAELVDKTGCDFAADGVDDQYEIKHALSMCRGSSCTVTLSNGEFRMDAPDEDDQIKLRSKMKVAFSPDTVLVMDGAGELDRFVFAIDGTMEPVNDVYIGGRGTIAVTQPGDHGIHAKGDISKVFIGEGLKVRHLNPQLSTDEGIQITGSIEARDVTVRNVDVEGFGQGNTAFAAYGIELAGLVRNSNIENYTSRRNQHGLSLRGDCDRIQAAVRIDVEGEAIKLPEAFDGRTGSISTVTLAAGESIAFMYGGKFNIVTVDLLSGNTAPGAISIAVSDGDRNWIDVTTVRDTAASGDIALATDGQIEFDLPKGGTWQPGKIAGDAGYWVKLTAVANLSALRLAEAEVCQLPHLNTVSNMTVIGSTRAGLLVRSAGRNTVQDSVIESSRTHGVVSGESQSGQPAYSNQFLRVEVRNSGVNGYNFTSSPGAKVSGGLVTGNRSGIVQTDGSSPNSYYGDGLKVESNAGPGIQIWSDRTTVDGAEIRNNGAGTGTAAADRVGVRVSAGRGVTVADCVFGDDGTAPAQSTGVHVAAQAAGTTVRGNQFTGISTSILDEGSGTTTVDNNNG
jgi:hypothetical protein